MELALAKGRRAVCGWEANGGFLTGSDFQREGRELRALPTRDAFLPILGVLFAAAGRFLGSDLPPAAGPFQSSRSPQGFSSSCQFQDDDRLLSSG